MIKNTECIMPIQCVDINEVFEYVILVVMYTILMYWIFFFYTDNALQNYAEMCISCIRFEH